MNPAVSVFIAARNYGRFLADALNSVQRQTFTDWECVLVDDGSEDDSAQVARPFLADGRFRFYRSDAIGVTRAKNLAFHLTSAPLVAPLDGDDVWLPTKLERQVRLMRAEPKLGLIFTRRFLIDPEGGILQSPIVPFSRGMILDNILLDNFVCFSSTMARRDVIECIGGFDNRLDLALDYDLWLRIASHYPFDYIDEPLVKYRTGHGNLSTRLADRITIVLSIIRRALNRRGYSEAIPQAKQRAAWGSTYRTMGYILRNDEPANAALWYCRAAVQDRRWGATARALMKCLRFGVKKRLGLHGDEESTNPNASCNR